MEGINYELMAKDVRLIGRLVDILESSGPITVSTDHNNEAEITDREELDKVLSELLKRTVTKLQLFTS